MKRSTIKKALENYDSQKGYGRILIKEEPHIKELRCFYEELKEDHLSPSSLKKLALILIGKNTRTDKSESGKAFERLVNKLGGYEALDTLNAAKQLTEDNVAFLEKHPDEAKVLTPLIISISKNTTASTIEKIFYAVEKMKDPAVLIAAFKELELLSRTQNASFFIDTLIKHDLNSDEVMTLLKEAEHSVAIHRLLKVLAVENPSLITQPNFNNILKIKHPYIFYDFFKDLPQDQKSLDSLFQANDALNPGYKSNWSKDIIINFKEAAWNIQPYLETILSEEINNWQLRKATTKLIKLKLQPELLPLILHTIFAHSNESIKLSEAVEMLNEEGLDENFLKIAFAVPKFSNQVAAALMTLQKAQCYNETTKIYVCIHPEYALGLAQFWVQFSKAECLNPAPRATMLKQPQCASYTADVIEYLRDHKLHNERNILAICNAKLTSSTLLNMLHLMERAQLLDQKSLDILLPRLSFINTLYSGGVCLDNGGKLDSFNFDTLVSDPINAVALAEKLGGKSHDNDLPFYRDDGAQDFTTIRRNTKILCQGHRQGLFFPEMSPEQKQSFLKARGKTLAEAQKEILVEIAAYSGNQELEEETEHNIAQDTYSSFFKV